MKPLFGIWCLVLGILLSGCQAEKPLYKEHRVALGTFVHVVSENKEAAKIVFEEIERIDGLLSKYRPESEVSRLNESGELKVSAETFYVIKKALEFWRESGGAFDITIGPLMDLWGFTTQEYNIPEPQRIAEVLKGIGSDKIYLNETDNVINFLNSGMKIDLGGIAKGYAIDCAVKKLKEAKISTCLINAGGNVYGLGEKFGQFWKIAIQDPRQPGTIQPFGLKNQCVATSGDYEQSFFSEGKRYSHIMNPRTGSPADAGLSSVTVIAPDCLTADSLSTAIFVLGKEKGEALAGKFAGVKVQFIEKTN
jgi:thiamine biosynthesis lipoprotein